MLPELLRCSRFCYTLLQTLLHYEARFADPPRIFYEGYISYCSR
jgi:hypothetical protein